MYRSEALEKRLVTAPQWMMTLFAALCSFGVYFCMYAFRKPFTVAVFEGVSFLNIDYKIWLVTAQVIGYTLSKFYGIRFISSLNTTSRGATILILILSSWIFLCMFAVTPAPYNIIFLLANGFPLGMVWGIVFSYLEGRKTTEFMGAILATSFIFSSGFVKTVGKLVLLHWQVSEQWMPFITGALFILPLLVFTWLLDHTPMPSEEDQRLRTRRNPMTQQDRAAFITRFFPGLLIIVCSYVLLTILREFRDNFANELWTELGYGLQPQIFTQTEIPVALIVLFCMASLVLIKKNINAFIINHYVIAAGFLLSLISSLLFQKNLIGPELWMVLIGTGLYVSYVPFNCLYFERMIASFKVNGNVGFVMYIADAFGYLGSVLVLFGKHFFAIKLSWVSFFINSVYFISIAGLILTIIAMIYFRRKFEVSKPVTPVQYAI